MEWEERAQELNEYLKEFLKFKRAVRQKFNEKEMMVILEYGVLHSWRRECTVQRLDPVMEGQKNFIELHAGTESWENVSVEKSIPKKF